MEARLLIRSLDMILTACLKTRRCMRL